MSILESHSRPPRDHKIRCSKKDTHVESSSDIHYLSDSTNFCMKIDLSCFNGHFKIEEFKSVIRWEIEDKITLQLFFKLNDIVMAVEHAEALLEEGKIRIQNFRS
ncbi:unnamed protein product [Spirodela intermedia]|uniref:Uncharacterized protein n=1 Tax=Spirodela intermedia TaxID=51605 RepID=A0A7I8K8Z5_SPIIN|nr:unnamed protein product [Spirodela intermedia]